jgi:hypothetical protein
MFKTRYSHFEYVMMPFGLTNALVIFQHLMNNVFCEYLDNFMVCYIDDILIFSKNMEDHEWHVCVVLEKFWKVGFYAKLEKFEYLKWNSWVASSLEMALAWIFARFKPLLIGLLKMSNVFLDLPTFINVSLPIILQ